MDTLESLRAHRQGATQLEHATLPRHLRAYYSMGEGATAEAAELEKSDLLDDMAHLVIAGNLLIAVGGSPLIDSPGFLAQYPAKFPFSERSLQVPLLRSSREGLEVLRPIGPEMIGGAAGRRTVAVNNLASALRAIDETEEHGEGLKHAEVWDGERDGFYLDRDEESHYFCFNEILEGSRL